MRVLRVVGRLFAATILSSICVAPLYLVFAIVSGDGANDLLLPVLLMTPVFAFAGLLAIGLPIHLLFILLNWSRPHHYAISGFVIPLILVVVFQPFGADDSISVFVQAIFMGSFGAVVALVFWRIMLGNFERN